MIALHERYEKNCFEIKKRLILEDKSVVFQSWKKLVPELTKDEFISALEWVCEDPLDENGKLTREIGLTRDGVVKLQRTNDLLTCFYIISDTEPKHLWSGDSFRMPCDDKRFADEDGMITQSMKVSLSARDRV